MSRLEVGKMVMHDWSEYIGEIIEIREDSSKYNYLVAWHMPISIAPNGWYRSNVLIPFDSSKLTEEKS